MKRAPVPLGTRVRRLLLGVGIASLLGGVLLSIFRADLDQQVSSGADSYSRSALGHAAFVSLLEARGIRVLRSRFSSATRVGADDVLVVLEPRLRKDDQRARHLLERAIEEAPRVLVVLPRYEPMAATDDGAWVTQVQEVPDAEVAEVAALVLGDPEAAGSIEPVKSAPASQLLWSPNLLGFTPELRTPRLLPSEVVAATATPLLAASGQVLVAEVVGDARHRLLLTDPTLLENHALGRGDNAALALVLIDRLRGDAGRGNDGGVVLDETLHGYEVVPSAGRELLRMPLLPLTLHLAAVGGLLLWSALVRFGRPRTAAGDLPAGKQALLDNIADLMLVAGQTPAQLGRYLRDAAAQVAAALHAPSTLANREALAWLERRLDPAGAARLAALATEVAELGPRSTEASLLAAARRIHALRQELLQRG